MMGANDLMRELASIGCTIEANGDYLDISPAEGITHELRTQLRQNKAEILAELKRDGKRQKVIAMLHENEHANRAICAEPESDGSSVIMTLALRNLGTCELAIPSARYDPWRLLELVDQYGGNFTCTR
jgi:hypothetical protein